MAEKRLLAIDTAMSGCSAALMLGTTTISRSDSRPRARARLVLSLVQQVLEEAGVGLIELDALAFGRGPGAFTGVRIAAGVIQGLAMGCGLPVVPVSSLAALAQAAHRRHGWTRILACVDARMGEVYTGSFATDADGFAEPLAPEALLTPDAVAFTDQGSDWYGVGSWWSAHESLRVRLGTRLGDMDPDLEGNAVDIARLAIRHRDSAVNATAALPVYLRDTVAWKKSNA